VPANFNAYNVSDDLDRWIVRRNPLTHYLHRRTKVDVESYNLTYVRKQRFAQCM